VVAAAKQRAFPRSVRIGANIPKRTPRLDSNRQGPRSALTPMGSAPLTAGFVEPIDDVETGPLRERLNGHALALLTILVRPNVRGRRSSTVSNNLSALFPSCRADPEKAAGATNAERTMWKHRWGSPKKMPRLGMGAKSFAANVNPLHKLR
jgi:hypothetical protein